MLRILKKSCLQFFLKVWLNTKNSTFCPFLPLLTPLNRELFILELIENDSEHFRPWVEIFLRWGFGKAKTPKKVAIPLGYAFSLLTLILLRLQILVWWSDENDRVFTWAHWRPAVATDESPLLFFSLLSLFLLSLCFIDPDFALLLLLSLLCSFSWVLTVI